MDSNQKAELMKRTKVRIKRLVEPQKMKDEKEISFSSIGGCDTFLGRSLGYTKNRSTKYGLMRSDKGVNYVLTYYGNRTIATPDKFEFLYEYAKRRKGKVYKKDFADMETGPKKKVDRKRERMLLDWISIKFGSLADVPEEAPELIELRKVLGIE